MPYPNGPALAVPERSRVKVKAEVKKFGRMVRGIGINKDTLARMRSKLGIL